MSPQDYRESMTILASVQADTDQLLAWVTDKFRESPEFAECVNAAIEDLRRRACENPIILGVHACALVGMGQAMERLMSLVGEKQE